MHRSARRRAQEASTVAEKVVESEAVEVMTQVQG